MKSPKIFGGFIFYCYLCIKQKKQIKIMKTLLRKAGEQLHKFISNGGWISILVFAFFGILFAVVGHYGTMGFNWKWFLFFELPLYAFCGWALYKVFKLIKNNPDVFKY